MDRSRVVVVKSGKIHASSGDVDGSLLRRMYERGIQLSSGETDPREGLRHLFAPGDRIGIKINTIGGKRLSTRPDVALPLAGWLAEKNVSPGHVVIWDRTNRELREAGYRLSTSTDRIRIFGTDTEGAGYGSELVIHGAMGSLFSTIQEELATSSISLAVLKDHGLAGVTGGMKNYFGAIHNPNKCHDGRCDPYVAQIFGTAPIKGKHRLTVLDALTVQYHKGPAFHSRWAEPCGTLVFGVDPVAVDVIGWRLIERLRAKNGLPSLAEEKREPTYLATAEKMGLGVADPGRIEVMEDSV
jgi:uncharacterized protein (DUF362 family)